MSQFNLFFFEACLPRNLEFVILQLIFVLKQLAVAIKLFKLNAVVNRECQKGCLALDNLKL